uniref:non-specific serine/threonine protein kinase n=1 Tax=Macrostomum lignano TaxID=282301 RepID=A0A1I8FXY9_9PLAT
MASGDLAGPAGLSGLRLLQQGAEARLYAAEFYGRPAIVKERFAKRYRHPQLDDHLAKERTKSEAKSLLRCRRAGIRVPAVFHLDLGSRRLCLELIEGGLTVRDFVNRTIGCPSVSARDAALARLSLQLGQTLASMHAANIVHGDLTTSNMLLTPAPDSGAELPDWNSLAMIDFGLSFVSADVEDKAVDLYVLERAFISSHPNTEAQFAAVLDTYRRLSKQGKIVLRKLDEQGAMPKRKPALKAASASGSQQPTAAAACQPLSIRCTCKSCSYYANVTSRIDRRLVTRSARPAAGSGRCAVCCPRLLAASIQEAEAEWQRARRCAELRKLRRLVWTMRTTFICISSDFVGHWPSPRRSFWTFHRWHHVTRNTLMRISRASLIKPRLLDILSESPKHLAINTRLDRVTISASPAAEQRPANKRPRA